MPRNSHAGRSRGDIAGSVDHYEQEYTEGIEKLTEAKDDVECERETIEGMEGLGTLEGMEAVMNSLRAAEDTSRGEFTEQDDALQESRSESQELENELHEQAEANTTDMERIGQAGQAVSSDAARASLEQAETQVREDLELLQGEEDRAREAREANEQDGNALRQFVFGSGG